MSILNGQINEGIPPCIGDKNVETDRLTDEGHGRVWNRVLRERRAMKGQREIKKSEYKGKEETLTRLGTVLSLFQSNDSHNINVTARPNVVY